MPSWATGFLLLALFAAPLSSRGQAPTTAQANCSDPSANCQSSALNANQNLVMPGRAGDGSGTGARSTDSQQPYVDSAGSDARRSGSLGTVDVVFPPEPPTDFQKLAQSATGEALSIFGHDLFQHAPSTFAPADRIPVTADYVLGPGDEVLLRFWGPESFNSQLTVDTAGSIYIPKVGAVHVAGLRYDQLQKQISSQIGHVFRNYNLSVDLGHLRSIQVYVMGEARRPGAYTISSLSTVLNALFASGGPNAQGSLRHVTVRRIGQPPAEFDMYDLMLRGDQTQNIRLQQGDTIFIPAAGPQVGLAGSVRHPAIYEIKDETTVQRLLELAGGLSPTASRKQLSLDRIDADDIRQTLSVKLDDAGKAMPLRDGDVLYVEHISASFEKTVTIRGNLANPGRFAWHEGMHLSDIIPDRRSLLTNNYWQERNHLGVPTPLFEPGTSTSMIAPPTGTLADTSRTTQAATQSTAFLNGLLGSAGPQGANASQGVAGQLPGMQSGLLALDSLQPQGSVDLGKLLRIDIPVPEIDWSYAVIERLDPGTLRSSLLPFNLGRLVQEHDPTQDLLLQPGDIVTILSQADVHVAQDEQTKYIRLEGEFLSAGVYSVGPDETLDQVVRRAGGFSSKAYLYGSSLFRESARIFQQQRLDEYISTLSADMERQAAVRAASSLNGALDPTSLLEQRNLVTQLRQVRATGRMVLEFTPESIGVESVPRLTLENGDIFRVPSRPSIVSVLGSVYGQNVFVYDPQRRVKDYLALAGKPNRIADSKHAFIIRADGSIYSRDRAQVAWSNNFNAARISPGDAIVIPEKLVKPSAIRALLDYSQVVSSFGLAAAAIGILGNQ